MFFMKIKFFTSQMTTEKQLSVILLVINKGGKMLINRKASYSTENINQSNMATDTWIIMYR